MADAAPVFSQQQGGYAAVVKQFGGSYRSSFASMYESAGEYSGKLCTPLAVNFCLQNDFLTFLATGGMKKCIDLYDSNQVVLGGGQQQEIANYTLNVLYAGRLIANSLRNVDLSRSLHQFLVVCLPTKGKAALSITSGNIVHTLGIEVGEYQVILFDPDEGFSSFPDKASLGKFLEHYVKQIRGLTQGNAMIGAVQ